MASNRLAYDLGAIDSALDPGTGGTFPVNNRSLVRFEMVSAAGSETRTLANPFATGQIVTLIHGVDGGDIDITVTDGFDAGGDTSMNTTTAGDFVTFISVKTAATTYRWRILAFEGFTGITVEGDALDLDGLADGLILDTDADTTISSPTDDQIDFEISGSDDFRMTANSFDVLAGSEISGSQGATQGMFMPTGAQQALSASSVVANLTSYYTAWTTTGSNDTMTLADSTTIGHVKKIQQIVDGGDGILTPATFVDGTTVTFATVADYVILQWIGATGWRAIELGNDADGATAPAVA